jgi:guanylate kinase
MIVLAGASASGKTEVAKILAKDYGLTKVITTTTRPMRDGEVDKRDYFFVTAQKFDEMLENEEFVEYTVYNGNLYGSTKDQIQDDKCIIVDPIGLKAYIELNNKNIVSFFLDSKEKTRYQRMISRGDKIEDAKKRIINDKVAFKKAFIAKVDFIIDSENATLEELAKEIFNKYQDALNSRK